MRKLKDALRLKFEGQQSHQQIATALGISKGVVTTYVGLAVAARLDWPAIAAMDEASLERRLPSSARTTAALPRASNAPCDKVTAQARNTTLALYVIARDKAIPPPAVIARHEAIHGLPRSARNDRKIGI
jgi:hypothetical protein